MRRRLDAELVRRGLALTRSAAADAIRSGRVTVAGRPAMKAGTLVAPHEPVAIAGPARRYASRAGEKLAAALDRFAVDASGRLALDVGASTGGFTDVLLRRGAARVVAVDVGYGQLDWAIRTDPRVIVMERTNARDLSPTALPYRPDLVTADVSFISLRTVIPALDAIAEPAVDVDLLLLVKPQFEAGRDQVGRGGVVRDPAVWAGAIRSIAAAASDHGFGPFGVMASPVVGPAGNVEFVMHAGRRVHDRTRERTGEPGGAGSPDRDSVEAAIEQAIGEGSAVRDGRVRAEAPVPEVPEGHDA